MKELYVEELANHSGHESCADNREDMREALDSGIYRLGIEPRKALIRASTSFRRTEDNTRSIVMQDVMGSAWSKTLYMYRNSMHENREILQLTLDINMSKARVENPIGIQQR